MGKPSVGGVIAGIKNILSPPKRPKVIQPVFKKCERCGRYLFEARALSRGMGPMCWRHHYGANYQKRLEEQGQMRLFPRAEGEVASEPKEATMPKAKSKKPKKPKY